MGEFQSKVEDILVNSISDCYSHMDKDYTDCIRCVSCTGINNSGDIICCREIEDNKHIGYCYGK